MRIVVLTNDTFCAIGLSILPTERRVQQCTKLGCHVLERDRNAPVHSRSQVMLQELPVGKSTGKIDK